MSGSWALLPPELRLQILKEVSRQKGCGSCAAVCSEWKAFLEPQNFHRLDLRVSCLEQLGHMTTRTAGLVHQIWLNIELPRYSCRSCQSPTSESRSSRHSAIFRSATQKLFTVLSAWKPTGCLALELSTFSPSDPEHWFKKYCIGLDIQPDGESEQQEDPAGWHDPKHGWVDGRQVESLSASGLSALFELLCFSLPESLPEVHTVTRLVIRREYRRQIIPSVLRLLLQKLPRLQTIVYEPWRGTFKSACDREFASMVRDALPSHVEMLSILRIPILSLCQR